MSNLNFPYSSAPLRTVEEIQFGLFSAKETERLAVIDIEYPETMYVEDLKTKPPDFSNIVNQG
jgi:DNA-directed RNA polymerase II subunit RPB1